MTETIKLWIPTPPSVNQYWMQTRNGVKNTKAARKFKARVGQWVAFGIAKARAANQLPLECPVQLDIIHLRAGKRLIDVDNLLKGTLDALNKRIYGDDSQVVDLRIRRGPIVGKGAGLAIRIGAAEQMKTAPEWALNLCA